MLIIYLFDVLKIRITMSLSNVLILLNDTLMRLTQLSILIYLKE